MIQKESPVTLLFQYYELLINFVKRDFAQRYVGSLLGMYWSIINPVITLLLYIVVFGFFLKVRLPGSDSIWDYSLYFAAGFLPFLAFQSTLLRASQSIIDNKNYVKKVPFPSELFHICSTLSESINLFIGISIYFVIFLILKGIPQPVILLIPLIILLQIFFTMSIAFILSAATVFFRDIPQILGSVFLIWFWATPIAYTAHSIPENFQWILTINPMYYILEMYREVLLYATIPNPIIFLSFTGFTVFLLFVSIKIFKCVKRGFSELL